MQESTESNTEVYCNCAPIPLPSVRQNRADHLGFLWFNLLEKVLEKGFFGQWGRGDGLYSSFCRIVTDRIEPGRSRSEPRKKPFFLILKYIEKNIH